MLLKKFERVLYTATISAVAIVASLGLTNASIAQVTVTSSVCIDSDGDGWGWDGQMSCRIANFVPTIGLCIDSDGDGWGWNGVESCLLDDDTAGGGGASGGDTGGMSSGGTGSETLAALAAGLPNFTVLATALQLTGLDSVLGDDGAEFTVFAPNDQAFELLGSDTIAALVADPDTLQQILLTHVVPGIVDASAALSLVGGTVTSAGGDSLALSVNDGSLYVNTSKVIATDIAASNGIVHVLDRVILPRPLTQASGSIVDVAVANGSFNTLVVALQAAGLDSVLADTSTQFTVFAPTDDAFAALGDDTIAALLSDVDALANVLLTHVVVGAGVDSTTALSLTGGAVDTASGISVNLSVRGHQLYVNNSQVVVADIVTDNGIIHVIDSVIQ